METQVKGPLTIIIDKDLFNIQIKWAKELTSSCPDCICCYNDPEDENYVADGTYPYFDKIGETEDKVIIAHVKLPLKNAEKGHGTVACKYYDEEKRVCTVHKVKPFGCMLFPLTIDFDGNLNYDPEFLYGNFCGMKIDLEKLRKANAEIQDYIKKKAGSYEYKPE